MEAKTLHFRIGAELGIRLMEIAQEHLLYNLDPQKAINVFIQSFGGQCPMEIVLALLKGDKIILVDEEDQTFLVVDRKDHMHLDKMYPKIDITKWVEDKYKEIGDRGKDLGRWLDEVTRRLKTGFFSSTELRFDIRVDNIIKFANGNEDPVLDEIRDDARIRELIDVIRITKAYLEMTAKLQIVFKSLHSWYPKFHIETASHAMIVSVMSKLQYLLNSQFLTEESDDGTVQNFIDAQIENDEILSKGIKPVNIMDNYSAGWLAPDGKTYYGLNGEIANMLHNQLADSMYEAGIIPQNEKNKENPDQWLDANGWVKQHGNWILYGGYEGSSHYANLDEETRKGLGMKEEDYKDVPMTKEQQHTIYLFGQRCCDGKLKIGMAQHLISVVMFETIEPLQFKMKWFKF